jgi:hypothetical protein
MEVAADKHKAAFAVFAGSPWSVEIRIHRHVHTLKNKAMRRSSEIDDTFCAQ